MKQVSHRGYLLVEVPPMTGSYTLRTTPHCDYGSISFYNKFNGRETLRLIPKGFHEWAYLSDDKKSLTIKLKTNE